MKSDNVVWHTTAISREDHNRLHGHRSLILWFTGLSGAGKSTLANALEAQLHNQGCATIVLDGDNVRHGLCGDLGFSAEDRVENIRRIGEMAKLFINAGVIAAATGELPYISAKFGIGLGSSLLRFYLLYVARLSVSKSGRQTGLTIVP